MDTILKFLLSYLEKNPQILEQLITTLINHILNTPSTQANLVNAAIVRLGSPPVAPSFTVTKDS